MAYGISLGPKPDVGLWGKIFVGKGNDGTIYKNTSAPWLPGKELGRFKTTKEEDEYLIGVMKLMKGKELPYGVIYGIDCRLFSENTFNALAEIIKNRREDCAE